VSLKRILAVLMAMGLVLTACNGDDDDAVDTPAADPAVPADPDDDDEPDEPDDDDVPDDVDPEDIDFDYGVTDDTIRIGMLADLSGIFAPLVVEIVESHLVYWEMVNDEGGIAGRDVEIVVLDQGYDVPRHIELYQRMRSEGPEGVVMLSLSTGSPHTSAVIDEMERDDIIGIPLTWYSGWWDPDFGENAAQMYTHYCIEAMNAISFMNDLIQDELGEDTRLAIISFPGEYGQDGASGAKLAAEALGIEIVYDGEGEVVAGADQTPVISQLLAAQPNLVYATTNPTTTAEIFGGVQAQGLNAFWTGNSPSMSFHLLGTDLGPDLSEYYYHSTYTAVWGVDEPGMEDLDREMQERRPDAPVSDVYILGWTYAQATHQILEHAVSRGDLTRAGVKAAMQDPDLTVDFGGLAPEQTWGGDDPDVYTVRESYMYSLDHTAYNIVPVTEEGGASGFILEEGPFAAEISQEFSWDGPCFAPTA
jgi:ABC-type branched-subunit amino acid transport system substrate-binding protein